MPDPDLRTAGEVAGLIGDPVSAQERGGNVGDLGKTRGVGVSGIIAILERLDMGDGLGLSSRPWVFWVYRAGEVIGTIDLVSGSIDIDPEILGPRITELIAEVV